jgi:hypothetical protein
MRVYQAATVVILSAVSAGLSGQSATSPATGSVSPLSSAAAPVSPPATADMRSDRQKALAQQAQRLVDMATELKVQVDKTNKNILSLEVVRKAEEIETFAHHMKEQAKK